MTRYTDFTPDDAREGIAVPQAEDDKYSRGVLGVVTGSTAYPGAAVLGVEAALHTGVGMVRYLGEARPTDFVLQRRPEAVTATGRVQAWLIGSGMDAALRDSATAARLDAALASAHPIVIDAGALDLLSRAKGQTIITPHFRELARVLGSTRQEIADDPAGAAAEAAHTLEVTVLLKGHRTYIAGADGTHLVAASAPAWLATAGAGDALGGILGALVATHSQLIVRDPSALARLGATASVLHGLAAQRASSGGPLTILDLIEELPRVIAGLLAR